MSTSAAAVEGPRADDRDTVAALGAALTSAGYTEQRLEDVLGIERALNPDPVELPYRLLVLAQHGRLATLVKLFQLALTVERDEAAEALAPVPLERLAATGLLVVDGDGVRSSAALTPFSDLVVASDWEPEESAPERADHVLGLSTPSRALASLGVREPVESALDVGTGCGLQALLAARHAGRIVATDVSARALQFTQFNAALNGVENLDLREGSLFDPVEGERFGSIVCHAPYVVSPDTEFVFRDSGLPGDSFCEVLLRRMPTYLEEGGFGHALVSWAHGADEDWSAPLRSWLEGSGCDALLLRHSSQEPLDYAAGWNRILGLEPEAYADALARWLAYYRDLGIERVGWGALVLRKRRGGGGVTALDASLLAVGEAGEHVARLLAAREYLGALGGDRALLHERLSLPADHRLEQTLAIRDGGGAIEASVLRLDGGLALRVDLDTSTPKLLSELSRGRTVAAALAAVVPDGARRNEIEASVTAGVRRLVELGFLIPAGSAQ